MYSRLLLVMTMMWTLGGAIAAAQTSDKPTIAILRFGGTAEETTFSEIGVLYMLQADGFISAEERARLNLRQDLEGENLNIFWGDAGWDLATANLMVDDALGREAQVLITLTTPVTRAAVNATADLDEPPAVLFASVFNPVEAGIAASACDKPAHVTGSVIQAPYDRVLSLLREQNPELDSIGVISSSNEISGLTGAAEIGALAAAQGINVDQAVVMRLADFPLAAQSLADKAVDAIVAPIDAVTAQALPVISEIGNEGGVPFLYPILGSIYHGATFGVGFVDHYEQGLHLGRLLTGVLTGELDTATTGIRAFTGDRHSVNLDAADRQGIVIPADLIDSADLVMQDGVARQSKAFREAYAMRDVEELQSDEAREAASATLESLRCE